MKLNIKNSKKGFTLVEILLVVGFIAIASIGIYVVYQKVDAGGKANTESRNLDTIRAGVKNLYATAGNYAGLVQANVVSAQLVPESMVQPDASLRNTFGGTVTIAPSGTDALGNGGFDITYPNVPTAVCIKLAPNAAAQFDRLLIGSTLIKSPAQQAINPADIVTGCTSAANVNMVFSSYWFVFITNKKLPYGSFFVWLIYSHFFINLYKKDFYEIWY